MPPAPAGPLLTLADDAVRVRPLTDHEREVLTSDRSTLSVLRVFLLAVAALAAYTASSSSASPPLLAALVAGLALLIALAQRKLHRHTRELAGEMLEVDGEHRRLRVLVATGRTFAIDTAERGPA